MECVAWWMYDQTSHLIHLPMGNLNPGSKRYLNKKVSYLKKFRKKTRESCEQVCYALVYVNTSGCCLQYNWQMSGSVIDKQRKFLPHGFSSFSLLWETHKSKNLPYWNTSSSECLKHQYFPRASHLVGAQQGAVWHSGSEVGPCALSGPPLPHL